MYEGIVQELIDELGRLPGIGPKSAQRIAFHILQTESFDVTRLAEVLVEVRDKVRFCEICGNVTEQETCSICRDPRRSAAIICVVEEAKDVARSSAPGSSAASTTCSAGRSARSTASGPTTCASAS